MTDEEFNRQQFQRLFNNLNAYKVASRKATEEVVSEKGNRLRYRLFVGYKAARWGGKRSKGIAIREFKKRVEEGKGIRVRQGIDTSKAPTSSRTGKPLNERQKQVAAELALRQQSIGVLGASFLVRRWNKKQSRLRRNVTGARGRLLAEITFDTSPISDFAKYEIKGYTNALDAVGREKRIIGTAMAEVNADMEKYLKRKQEEAMRQTVSR